jgi:hypothetical protein
MQSSICDHEPIDPIPPHLKSLFYPERLPPDFARDYHVLGFDADHCLVKYNVFNLSKLMTKALTEDLIANEGYPTALLDIPLDVHGIGLNNSVWDIQNNLIV